MKKLLLSTIVLFAFSLSIIVFQISCKKKAEAQTQAPNEGLKQLGKIIFTKNHEAYIANYDGSSVQKIAISFPDNNQNNSIDEVKLSPDGKKVFAELYFGATNTNAIYSCNLDGSDLKKITDNSSNLQGVY